MKNTLFVCNLHFLEKVKGDFSGYGMGIRYTYYLKGNKYTANNCIVSQGVIQVTVYNGEFPLI